MVGRAVLVGLAIGLAVPAGAQERAEDRAAMVRTIEAHASALPGQMAAALGRERLDPRVLEVMATVPRHEFVPPGEAPYAYDDRPLPIGYGQTISQPFIVALMTDLLAVGPDAVVLEIGTGSGYQAAVLAPLVARVHTIEIVPELAASAAERLARLGYGAVAVRAGDGYYGWAEAGPFDGIVVTAAAGQIPPPLVEQLKPGGRMVVPVGAPYSLQLLMLVEKLPDGGVRTRQLLPVTFVPLTRAE